MAMSGSANLDSRSLFLNYELMVAFHDNDLMIRVAGDTLALTPPLIVTEDQIGEIVDKVAKVIRAVA